MSLLEGRSPLRNRRDFGACLKVDTGGGVWSSSDSEFEPESGLCGRFLLDEVVMEDRVLRNDDTSGAGNRDGPGVAFFWGRGRREVELSGVGGSAFFERMKLRLGRGGLVAVSLSVAAKIVSICKCGATSVNTTLTGFWS